MHLTRLVSLALDEDLGAGDLTTLATIDKHARGAATIRAKQALVVAGQDAATEVFKQVADRYGAQVEYQIEAVDGTAVADGTVIARIQGGMQTILSAERLALNLLMKLSGIATNVRPYVEAAQGKIRVVDTRKTTPLLRALEKAAVRAGGAHNHRFALYDGIMVKDNHIQAAGSLKAAVQNCRDSAHHLVRVEVEVEDVAQLHLALASDADVIMLDNMSDELMAECVLITRKTRANVILEASGNITPKRIESIRDLGIDVVSSGGLIHQARWVDLSLKVVEENV